MDINKLCLDSSLYLALLDIEAEIKKKHPLGNGNIETIGDESLASLILSKPEDPF